MVLKFSRTFPHFKIPDQKIIIIIIYIWQICWVIIWFKTSTKKVLGEIWSSIGIKWMYINDLDECIYLKSTNVAT